MVECRGSVFLILLGKVERNTDASKRPWVGQGIQLISFRSRLDLLGAGVLLFIYMDQRFLLPAEPRLGAPVERLE